MGVVCHYLDSSFKNILGQKKVHKRDYDAGKYSNERLLQLYYDNLDALIVIVNRLHSENIHCYRVSSELLPLIDIVSDDVKHNQKLAAKLKQAGDAAKLVGMRMIFHPDQFCVLSSDTPTVIDNAIRSLDVHAWMFDTMGFDATPYYAINIHGGKGDRSEKLIDTINNRLSKNVHSRLTLENDELSYTVTDLLSVSARTGVPVCLDSHHHALNPGSLTIEDAFYATYNTWPTDIRPIQHLSNSRDGVSNTDSVSKRRAHSDYICHIPQIQLDGNNCSLIDIEIEAKMKNLAVYKLSIDSGALLTT